MSANNHYKKRDWPTIIPDWEKSGLSKRAYCREHNIPATSFYDAVNECKHLPIEERPKIKLVTTPDFQGNGFVKVVQEDNPDDNAKSIIRVIPNVEEENSHCECLIESPNGLRMTLQKVDARFLRSLLSL